MANIDEQAIRACRAHWDQVAKPLYGLGYLEDAVARIAGIAHTPDVRLSKRCVLVFCADNGVVAQGVTQTGSEVTALVARGIAEGSANVNAMARVAHADVYPVDAGMFTEIEHPAMRVIKVARGTADITQGPAMTRAQCMSVIEESALLTGVMKDMGYCAIATGEMGIGNTTTSSAILSVLLNRPAEEITGRGAGLSDEGLARKRAAVKQAINVNRPDALDPVDVLSKVGGYDIAAMAGAFLGGFRYGLPVVIDGLISATAALIAARIEPKAQKFMLASHVSREPAGALLLSQLGLRPIIQAGMALGEGTGAVALFPLLDMALAVYHQNHTFEALGMAAYEHQPSDKT